MRARRFTFVRHAATVYNDLHLLNGDPRLPVPLDPGGRVAAGVLGRRLQHCPFDLALHTRFARTRETLMLLLGHRAGVRVAVEPAFDDIDVGIRLSSGVHPDLYVEKLSDEWLLPLCSPRLLEGEYPLTSAQDLKRFTLIQVDLPGVVPTWTDWMEMAGLDGIDSTRGLRLNVADHALDAASEGVGVVLAYKMVAARDIALKRLVVPFGPEIPLPGRAYYFVCAKGQEKRAPIKAFRDWIFSEMQETHAALREMPVGAGG